MSQIMLHPQHGLNPTMPICFWCGEPTGEIALLGRSYKDLAPPHMVLNYNHCPSCQQRIDNAAGVVIIEAVDRPNGNPEIQSGVYPTGRWVVITHEAAGRMFNIPVKDKAFMSSDAFEQMFGAHINGSGDETHI